MASSLSSLSTEYLRYTVTATVNGIPYNPSGDTVSFAFPASGVSPSTWYTGSWEQVGTTYVARILIGPGGQAISGGTYDVWIKVTDSPEIPVRKIDTLTIS